MVRFELTTFALSARHSTTELHSIKVGVDINNLPVSVFGLKNLSPTNRSFITEEVNLRDHKGQAGTPRIEPRPHVLQTYVPTSLHHVPTQCNLCTIDSYPTHVKSVGVLLVFSKSE
jgi:hypothetical protein